MNSTIFIKEIQSHISNNELPTALKKLQVLLENSPQLNEAIHQTSRFHDIQKQIRLGVISFEDASVTKNKIREGLLALLDEIKIQEKEPTIQHELEKAISTVNSKNIVVGNITAEGDVMIGDRTIYTETDTSRRLRYFLFLFVPLLAIGGAYLWYQNQVSKIPLTMNVVLKNKTPHSTLKEPSGKLTLTYGAKPTTQQGISATATFQNIPSNYSNESMNLKYDAKGFHSLDTTFQYQEVISLFLSRNDDFAIFKGQIKDEDGNKLEGVNISLPCCDIMMSTNTDGIFSLHIPFKYQDYRQRIELSKETYQAENYERPVMVGEMHKFVLKK